MSYKRNNNIYTLDAKALHGLLNQSIQLRVGFLDLVENHVKEKSLRSLKMSSLLGV